MSVIYIALPVAIVLAVLGLLAFAWATRKGQFDDLDTPSVRMLYDDEDELPRRTADSAKREGDSGES